MESAVSLDGHSVALIIGFFAVSLLYSTVGHGGASGYLAVMSLLSVPAAELRPTALALNLLVASIATASFGRAGHLSWSLTWPFLVLSVPGAFLGGSLPLPRAAIGLAVGATLLFAAYRLASQPVSEREVAAPKSRALLVAIGAVLGLVAGLTGTGGGIFLSPLLVLAGWASPLASSASAALFILLNSAAGLAGQLASGQSLNTLHPLLLFAAGAAVIAGGSIGSRLGARRLASPVLRRLLSLVLVVAAAKLAWSALH